MTFTKQKIVLLISAVVGAISAFLPWATFPGGSISGTYEGGDGVYTLIAFAVAAVLCLFVDKFNAAKIIAIICGAIGVAVIVINYIDFPPGLSVGFGAILTVLAGVALIVVPFVLKD